MSAKFWLLHDRIVYRTLWLWACGMVAATVFGVEAPHATQIAAFLALMLAASKH